MSDNPMKDYVDNFRANLPSGVTFESVTARYFFNGKRFISEWDVERYREYIIKFGYATGETDPPVINSSGYNDTTKRITLDLSDASPPITVVLGSIANPNTATKSDLLNGTGDVLENDSFQIGTGSTSTETNFTDETADEIHYYLIDDEGNETAIQIITGVTIDSTAAVLTNVVDEADGQTAATWGVESDTAAGTIYAGLRLTSNPKLDEGDIIATTGNCLQTDTDTSPTADANNGGAFSGLTAGTSYTVDTTQDDGFGNITVSVAGDGFTTISDADAANYISRGIANGGGSLEPAVVMAIDDFFIALKANSLLTDTAVSCILAAWPNVDGALTPLLPAMTAPSAFNVDPADYDRKLGIKGDGSTLYIDTNRPNNSSGQNDQSLSVYVSEAPTGTNGQFLASSGSVATIGSNSLWLFSGNAIFSSRAPGGTDGSNYIQRIGNFSTTGLFSVYRGASATMGARVGGSNTTQSVTSSTPNSANIFLLARPDSGGSPANFSTARIAFYEEGANKNVATLDTIVSQLMTDLDGAIA